VADEAPQYVLLQVRLAVWCFQATQPVQAGEEGAAGVLVPAVDAAIAVPSGPGIRFRGSDLVDQITQAAHDDFGDRHGGKVGKDGKEGKEDLPDLPVLHVTYVLASTIPFSEHGQEECCRERPGARRPFPCPTCGGCKWRCGKLDCCPSGLICIPAWSQAYGSWLRNWSRWFCGIGFKA